MADATGARAPPRHRRAWPPKRMYAGHILATSRLRRPRVSGACVAKRGPHVAKRGPHGRKRWGQRAGPAHEKAGGAWRWRGAPPLPLAAGGSAACAVAAQEGDDVPRRLGRQPHVSLRAPLLGRDSQRASHGLERESCSRGAHPMGLCPDTSGQPAVRAAATDAAAARWTPRRHTTSSTATVQPERPRPVEEGVVGGIPAGGADGGGGVERRGKRCAGGGWGGEGSCLLPLGLQASRC